MKEKSSLGKVLVLVKRACPDISPENEAAIVDEIDKLVRGMCDIAAEHTREVLLERLANIKEEVDEGASTDMVMDVYDMLIEHARDLAKEDAAELPVKFFKHDVDKVVWLRRSATEHYLSMRDLLNLTVPETD